MRVAVLGATGLVGREMLKVLEQRDFPVDELVPLASPRSAGRTVPFRGREVPVRPVSAEGFEGVSVALFSAGSGPSRAWAPEAAARGAAVIDNSSAWRMDPKVPLVVPEVNPEALEGHGGIIANPNCATIQAVVALAPLHRAAGLVGLMVVSFQSVSGTGRAALEELESGARRILEGEEPPEPRVYPRPIAFDCLPQIGPVDAEGHCEEEWKLVRESRKILSLPDLPVSATTVRVPVFRGHGETVLCRFGRPLSPEEARSLLVGAPGVRLMDDPARAEWPTQRIAAGTDPVYVGRIRRDPADERGLWMWVAADNLRKGAALNAVQIAEALRERGGLRD